MADIEIAGYTDLVRIGRGGLATVYAATQIAFGRMVAIKVLDVDLDDAGRKRFERECLATGMVAHHPNVVTVHDAGETDDGHPYLVLEHLPAGSLADHLKTHGPLELDDVIRIGVDIALALATAHDAGIIHRDVKPANLLLADQRTPKLADFGIAWISTDPRYAGSSTRSYSPDHVAPEQFTEAELTPAADVYSLASTVFTLIEGRPPHADSPQSTIHVMLSRKAAGKPPAWGTRIPAPLRSILEPALHPDPTQRPTADTLATQLQRCLTTTVHTPTPPPPTPTPANIPWYDWNPQPPPVATPTPVDKPHRDPPPLPPLAAPEPLDSDSSVAAFKKQSTDDGGDASGIRTSDTTIELSDADNTGHSAREDGDQPAATPTGEAAATTGSSRRRWAVMATGTVFVLAMALVALSFGNSATDREAETASDSVASSTPPTIATTTTVPLVPPPPAQWTTGLYASADGLTWVESSTSHDIGDLINWSGGTWLSLSYPYRTVSTSTDGYNWQSTPTVGLSGYDNIWNLSSGNGVWMALGAPPSDGDLHRSHILSSRNGTDWTVYDPGDDRLISTLAFGDGRWVATGTVLSGQLTEEGDRSGAGSLTLSSVDGTEWSATTRNNRFSADNAFGFANNDAVFPTGLAYGDGQWVQMSSFQRDGESESYSSISSDAFSWISQSLPNEFLLQNTRYGGGRWLAAGFTTGGLGTYTSTDGLNWELVEELEDDLLTSFAYGDGQWMACSFDGLGYTSADGLTWQRITVEALIDPTGAESDFGIDALYCSAIFHAG